MTHCRGYRAAAVARVVADAEHAAHVTGLGIDAEPHAPLPEGVLDTIARPDELPVLVALAVERPRVHWDRLVFSAKESVYKAWFPVARRWLGFSEASVEFAPDDADGDVRHVSARILPSGAPITRMSGRWTIESGLVLTAITFDGLPAGAARAGSGRGALRGFRRHRPPSSVISSSVEAIAAATMVLSLATADAAGTPHVNMAFFALGDEFDLFFVSEPSTQHGKNSSSRAEAAAAIWLPPPEFGEGLRGMQVAGRVRGVVGAEAEEAFEAYRGRIPRSGAIRRHGRRIWTGPGAAACPVPGRAAAAGR